MKPETRNLKPYSNPKPETRKFGFRGTHLVDGSSDFGFRIWGLIKVSDLGFGVSRSGFILVVLLTATALVLVLGTSLAGLVASEFRRTRRVAADEQAFWLAESGLDAVSWRANLNPLLLKNSRTVRLDHLATDGTSRGSSNIVIEPGSGDCGVNAILKSTGETPNATARRRVARTMTKTNVANFAALSGGPLWIGPNVEVKGDLHTNTGARIDGEIEGKVTAAKGAYTCTPDHGCDPTATKPGVWGKGADEATFPVPAIDFETLQPNYADLKNRAQRNGTYLAPSGARGWRLIFRADGTVSTSTVNQVETAVCAYDAGPQATSSCRQSGNPTGLGWFLDSTQIKRETTAATLTLPPVQPGSCNPDRVIFVEDTAWLEGSIPERLTVVIARVPDQPQNRPLAIIPNVLETPAGPGARPLILSQGDIRFPENIPDHFEIDTLLVAPQARILRPRYLGTNRIRSQFEFFGTATAPFVRWSWYDGKTGTLLSGFRAEEWKIDKNLITLPPPATPTLEGAENTEWRELPAPPI